MMTFGFSYILDGLILVLLVATIVYAARLSIHLKVFRDSRREFDVLFGQLTAHIDQAEKATAGLREAARESGRDLQSLVNESTSLFEELELMNEAGNNLAGRLEKLAERSGRVVSFQSEAGAGEPKRRRTGRKGDEKRAFAIHDPEFDGDGRQSEQMQDDLSLLEDDDGLPSSGSLHSRAERELYDALRGGGKKSVGGGEGAS